MDYAVYPAQLIQANPLNYIKVPKKAPRNIVKRTIITPEQFDTLLASYPFGTPFHVPLLLLYHTGMRLGEVLGLSWSDIDFAEKKITVRQQMVYLIRKGYFLTTLKTASSYRFIIMDEELSAILKHWRSKQEYFEQDLGDGYVYIYLEEDGRLISQSKMLPFAGERIHLVCTCPGGRIYKKQSLSQTLKQRRLNAHSFRHTQATFLTESGASPKAVAGRLGHFDTAITQNLYTHNTAKCKKKRR